MKNRINKTTKNQKLRNSSTSVLMAELKDEPELENISKAPPVVCKSSGKIRRFSAVKLMNKNDGFAVKLMNKKLLIGSDKGNVMASYIELVKDGEEEEEPAVSFGPNSVLVNYGPGWKLQTVIEPESYGN